LSKQLNQQNTLSSRDVDFQALPNGFKRNQVSIEMVGKA
jgi:hypothetical protein